MARTPLAQLLKRAKQVKLPREQQASPQQFARRLVVQGRQPPDLQSLFLYVSGERSRAVELGTAQSIETLSRLLPTAGARLQRDVSLEFVTRPRPGGWYLPDFDRIRLTHDPRAVPLVTHQAIHALDWGAAGDRRWASLVPDSPVNVLAREALELVRDQLEERALATVLLEMRTMPPRTRELLMSTLDGDRVPVTTAVDVLLSETQAPYTVEQIMEVFDRARHPFGGVLGEPIRRAFPDIAEPLIQIGALRPVGVPLGLFDRSQAERMAWANSLTLRNRYRDALAYYTSLNEVFARLMDQAIREAAARHGLWSVSSHRPDDVPLAVFRAELEDKTWALARQMGWT